MSPKHRDQLFTASQQREVEALLQDLGTVARCSYDQAARRIAYSAKQLGLFGDRELPPELEVGRVVRLLVIAKRLEIDRDEDHGRSLTCTLRSGLRLTIEALSNDHSRR